MFSPGIGLAFAFGGGFAFDLRPTPDHTHRIDREAAKLRWNALDLAPKDSYLIPETILPYRGYGINKPANSLS